MAVTRAGDIHLPIISPCQATLLPFLDPTPHKRHRPETAVI